MMMLGGIELNITINYQMITNNIGLNFKPVTCINLFNYISNLYFTFLILCHKPHLNNDSVKIFIFVLVIIISTCNFQGFSFQDKII